MSAVKFLTQHNAARCRNVSLPHVTVLPQQVSIDCASIREISDQKAGECNVQTLLAAGQTSVRWRGQGGRHPTVSSVEFDRQLDKASIWLEQWDYNTRCALLEALLRRSNYTQFQFLSTVLQPSLHRDFMYTACAQFLDGPQFKPISTHVSRELKDKLTSLRLDKIHRAKSVYLHDDNERISFQLPVIDSGLAARGTRSTRNCLQILRRSKAFWCKQPMSRSLNLTSSFLSVGSEVMLTDRLKLPGCSPISQSGTITQDAVSRFIEMPVRRHMQNETSHWQQKPPHQTDSCLTGDGSLHSPLGEANKKATKPGAMVAEYDLPKEGRQLLRWFVHCWNDTKKNEFFHKLLLKLDPREHYFMCRCLLLKQHKDFITQLPEKLSLYILSFLSPKELLEASRVSKGWQKLTSHNSLWEAKCQEVKLEVPVSANPLWKRVFRDNFFLPLNWNKGVCKVTDFTGHTQSVLTVTFDKDRLASGSADKTIRVWNIKTGDTLHVLKGHSKGIWCLLFFTKHLLVSGSFDATIRVWNLRTGTTARTLLGHAGPVWCMKHRGTTIVSGSQDRTAKVWDINRCLLLHTLAGHTAAIFAVDLNESGSIIITGSADKTVRLWTTETGKCQRTIWVSQTTAIMSVSYSQGYIACSYGNTICLYKGAKLLRTFNEHNKRVETVELRMVNLETGEGMLVSGGKDACCKYWDITKSDSIQTFEGHSQNVNCIHFDELRIASASSDHKIRLWDFNV